MGNIFLPCTEEGLPMRRILMVLWRKLCCQLDAQVQKSVVNTMKT